MQYPTYLADFSAASEPPKAQHVTLTPLQPESVLPLQPQPSELSFADQLQRSSSEKSPASMDFFIASPPFTFSAGQMDADRGSAGIYIPASAAMDPFGGLEESHEAGVEMDMDDPVLHQLQTLAEEANLGENLGQPQNLNIWEWFDIQQQL